MWIVHLALRRPYTFVVASLLLLLLFPLTPLPLKALLFLRRAVLAAAATLDPATGTFRTR